MPQVSQVCGNCGARWEGEKTKCPKCGQTTKIREGFLG